MALMKENEITIFSKILIMLLILVYAVSAVINIWLKHVPHPYSFVVGLIGFGLFIMAKLHNIKKGKYISFGTKEMSEGMANLYRLGYWLMVLGALLTFT